MKKISTLFKKDPQDLGRVINEVNTENEMIYVGIYTHSSVIDGLISFEEFDLRVASIGDNETLVKKDFDKLWESVNEIDTKDLKAEEWYMLGFKRNWEDDGSGSYNQCWFELVETSLIEIEL